MDLRDPSLFQTRAYVGGRFVEADDGRTCEVRDPASGAVIARVPRLGVTETGRAVGAAAAAFPAWKRRTAQERGAVVRRIGELLLEHQEDLARILTREQGKPLAESRAELAYAASFFEWFGEEARRVYGETVPAHRADARVLVTREPVGVCAAITPWNFPTAMIARKLAPALAVGCTMVAKPAEATPLSALALAALAERAGVPPGAFNVVTGDREDAAVIGGALTSDPRVRKLSFTGSTVVGKQLYADCAATVMRVSLELGGNAPFLVFDDADLDAAVQGVMLAKFRNCGQACVAANRILVQAGVYDAFRDRLAAAVASLTVGPGDRTGVDVGPLIDAKAHAKVSRHLADALARGAQRIVGGTPSPQGGTFFTPTLLTEVTPEMAMSVEETFGPLAGLMRFETEEQALRVANDTPMGLAAYFYARDVGRVTRVSEGLEYGMIGVNTGLVSTAIAPFGGIKESGIGREGSRHGIEEYLELKYTCLGGL